jgi:hypothetical protein
MQMLTIRYSRLELIVKEIYISIKTLKMQISMKLKELKLSKIPLCYQITISKYTMIIL